MNSLFEHLCSLVDASEPESKETQTKSKETPKLPEEGPSKKETQESSENETEKALSETKLSDEKSSVGKADVKEASEELCVDVSSEYLNDIKLRDAAVELIKDGKYCFHLDFYINVFFTSEKLTVLKN